MSKFYKTIRDTLSNLLFFRANEKRIFESMEDIGEARKLIQQIRPYTMLPEARLVSLYAQVKHCELNNVKGGYMECGVWKGGAVGLMALTNQRYGASRRHLYLFDAFDDICPPDPKLDGDQAIQDTLKYSNTEDIKNIRSATSKPIKGFYDALGGKGTLSQNRKLLISQIRYGEEYVHFYKGWFKNTMPKAYSRVNNLAILRIDADWYASVSICLQYFYPKVVKGGFIIIDDYGYYEGCTKAVNDYFSEHHIRLYANNVDSGCVYFIK